MAGKKNFINNTDRPLMVTLSVRKGDDPNNGNSEVGSFPLGANSSQEESYGTDRDVYLNAIRYEWSDGTGKYTGSIAVENRGDRSDDLMNTNSVMTFSSGGTEVKLVGSN